MHEIKLPQLGQSVEEASIVEWLKAEGDEVSQGEVIFTIQTDKAEIEYESQEAGVLRKILVEPDIDVPVMTVVGLIGGADEALPDLDQYGPALATPAEAPAAKEQVATATQKVAAPSAAPARSNGGAVSPRARRVAAERGVDASALAGSGVNGRVMSADVLSAKPSAAPVAAGDVTPLTPMRKIIAQRMAESKFSAPHFYVTIEVDMGEAVAFRKASPFKVSYNDLVLAACVRALQKHPNIQKQWSAQGIASPDGIHISMAVALDDGLVTPVIRDIEKMSLQGIAEEAKRLAEAARTNKLLPDDFFGHTFTVSNLGGFGVDNFTAIINQPDSAILAVGAMKDTPVVRDGGIYVRPVMKLTLSSDHRVIDGATAAKFMGSLKEVLETAQF